MPELETIAAFVVGFCLSFGTMIGIDGGIPMKRCTVACYYDRDPVVCLFEKALTCGQRDECVDRPHTRCVPLVVTLPWE